MDLYSWATVLEEVVGKYSTPAATAWLICTSFRLFTVVQVVVDTYGDEYNFQCASITKGCKNQCYMRYAPISMASFWTLAMFTLMAPFLFFNNLLKWVNIRTQINEEKKVAPSFMTRTLSITRKRKGRPKEIIWCPLIAFGLVIKLILVVVVECYILKFYMNLQCRKFGFVEENSPSAECTLKKFYERWQFLTIPEVYVCKPHEFNFQTWFGLERDMSLKGGVCQGVGMQNKCFIPKAIQKTFLNLILFVLTSFGLFFASIELVLTIFKQAYRAYKVFYKKEIGDKSRNLPEITNPLEFVEFNGGRYLSSEEEPMLLGNVVERRSSVKFQDEEKPLHTSSLKRKNNNNNRH